ncbi:MAG: hypothetical protein FJY95_22075 [Candidatus Handelsmanbacteria bacterium]|nr:hypothetical protein [Candidatus Handelsmanbacteria bacterium]
MPRRFASRRPASAYLAGKGGALGRCGDVAAEILEEVDADLDVGLFGNEGPDG